MKRSFMHNRSLNHTLTFLILLIALSLITACQPPQQPNSNANDNANTNTNTSNTATTSAPSGYIDLVGKWDGQAAGHPSTLVITNHMGDTFSGTETVGEYQIRIAGVVDLKTREITIRETDVIKGQGNYPLGAGTGTIAPNGRQMSGEWKTKGSASPFSFSK
ncbi:MAG TPA: hypothetical protein VGO69_04875 [Pyrinomonadaceae bacterium]|nr:hypothetical protein [Pyrinomonadaceae bacterium]